jgi:hypothetical protein
MESSKAKPKKRASLGRLKPKAKPASSKVLRKSKQDLKERRKKAGPSVSSIQSRQGRKKVKRASPPAQVGRKGVLTIALTVAGGMLALIVLLSQRSTVPRSPNLTGAAQQVERPNIAKFWEGTLSEVGVPVEHRSIEGKSPISFWSELLMRQPSLSKALKDRSPLNINSDIVPFVPERFDCTTYVETVIALARSRGLPSFFEELIRVRYSDSNPTYLSRNHFPEADWIPNNLQKGIVSDITDEVGSSGPLNVSTAEKVINRREWLERSLRAHRIDRSLAAVDSSRWDSVAARVRFLPLDEVDRIIGKIPDGSILNIVHRDTPSRSVLITHQGFVFQSSGVTLFRHANPGGQIRTEPLTQYLQRAVSRKGGATIVGLNVLRVHHP